MRPQVHEQRRPRRILETSVVIVLERIDPVDLPIKQAVSALTMARAKSGRAAELVGLIEIVAVEPSRGA